MGNIEIKTPLVVCANDYHDFSRMLNILNLSPHIMECDSEGNRKPEAKLFITEKASDGDYFYEHKYHAIIYIPGVDDAAAAKIAQEIEATLDPNY
jgi:hypothetical protein